MEEEGVMCDVVDFDNIISGTGAVLKSFGRLLSSGTVDLVRNKEAVAAATCCWACSCVNDNGLKGKRNGLSRMSIEIWRKYPYKLFFPQRYREV